uniref:Uncharacterized protein n=1 Tax=Kwoniella dejecticola CBS 10117 TaxID=1296121 RepID=A0A1A5ZZA2_9TREE|nr:uncharacterized protein I303_06707 [Kwoniella dejecticola CBS 10117]OBR83148.1 hypothetical protein I303_06707 [Kwoniella dejecticola CBS 10117]
MILPDTQLISRTPILCPPEDDYGSSRSDFQIRESVIDRPIPDVPHEKQVDGYAGCWMSDTGCWDPIADSTYSVKVGPKADPPAYKYGMYVGLYSTKYGGEDLSIVPDLTHSSDQDEGTAGCDQIRIPIKAIRRNLIVQTEFGK